MHTLTQRRSHDSRRFLSISVALAFSLSGCASLPSSGPTGSQITSAANDTAKGIGFPIVELSDFAALPPAPAAPAVFASTYVAPPTDLIGPGDVLEISVYESGVALFAGAVVTGAAQGNQAPGSQVERIAARVDDNGYIRIPYVAPLLASGTTAAQLAATIRRSLRGMSQNPQVVVAIRESITNSVIVSGDVGRPGRLVLSTNRETLSDAIALAGGYRGEAKDLAVRVQRLAVDTEFRLSDVISGAEQDIRIYPGDKISIVRSPRTFSVMGAPGRVEQLPFSASSISLAEAVALAGGTNPNLGDPQAIFVFRFVATPDGKESPVVYHINMMKVNSYFLSQRFAMQNKDILYIGNASANQPSKLIQIISQLFAPIVTVSNIAAAANN